MKNVQNRLVALLLIALAFSPPVSSQDDLAPELRHEVHRMYPYISIEKEELNEAHSLSDINEHYKSSWVREFISVEISTSYKGKIRSAVSNNDTLSQEQRDNIDMADVGKDISVKIQYMPENTLKHNDPKEINFTFIVEPENDAKYPGGQQELNDYLKERAIDKIPDGSFVQYDMTAVKFTISEAGEIIDAHLFEDSEEEAIDELLLETVCNMPAWTPAEYYNGVKVKQEFVLIVGSMENCMISLLNIRRD